MSGFGFPERYTSAAAADAARALAHRNVAARWRIAADGSVELVRPAGASVELHRIAPDGAATLLERSPKSWRRGLLEPAVGIAFVACFVVFAGIAVADGTGHRSLADSLAVVFALTIAAVFVVGIATPSDDAAVEKWLRARFGSAAEWARVPREGDLGPATANQQVAAAALADAHGRAADALVAADGTVAVATRQGRVRVIRHLDRSGAVLFEERARLPSAAQTWLALACAAGAAVLAAVTDGRRAWVAGALIPVFLLVAALRSPTHRAPLEGGWQHVRTDEPGE